MNNPAIDTLANQIENDLHRADIPALVTHWQELATVLSDDMEADKIVGYNLIGDRIRPLWVASITLAGHVAELVDVRDFIEQWPVTDHEHLKAVRESIARGESFPARELVARLSQD